MSVNIIVNGKNHEGWKAAQVRRSIDEISSSFAATVSEEWPGQAAAISIRAGDSCIVEIDGARMVTGYIDEVRPRYNSSEHLVAFSGRSKTGDLADCTADNTPNQWKAATLSTIISALVSPFGIKVVFEAGANEKFADFTLQQGETVFAAINRLCRTRGLLATDNVFGNLVITKVNKTRTVGMILHSNENGNGNVLSGEAEFSMSSRFSRYTIKGQSSGSDDFNGSAAAGVKVQVTDSNVPRYRPLTVIAESQIDNEAGKKRALWERARRAGNSVRMTHVVQGWRQTLKGDLWATNRIVRVDDDFMQIHGDFLISSTEFSISDSGLITTIVTGPPESFEPGEKIEKTENKTGYWVEQE